MIIILCLYLVALWAVFSKFKLVRWGWLSGTVSLLVAVISIPDGMSRDSLRLGMSGSATAFAGNAGVIGLLASILMWVSSYTAYL